MEYKDILESVTPRLGTIRAAVIGAGGIGFYCVEQIARLGVRNLLLVDDDRLDGTNLNRYPGVSPKDVGVYKVDILRKRLKKQFPGISVTAIKEQCGSDEADLLIERCDLIMAGVDNDRARYHINLLAAGRIPYFDMAAGVIAAQDGQTAWRGCRVKAVLPGGPCLVCQGLKAEALPPAHAPRGYLQGTDHTPPSVLPLNAAVSALGLDLVIKYLAGQNVPFHIRFDMLGYDLMKIREFRLPECPVCGDRVDKNEN